MDSKTIVLERAINLVEGENANQMMQWIQIG
jgi:hypothetical protein